jgi:hypothetical protein
MTLEEEVNKVFKNYKIHIEVSPTFEGEELRWYYYLTKVENQFIVTGLEHPEIDSPFEIPTYNSKEEAYLAAITYVTNLI